MKILLSITFFVFFMSNCLGQEFISISGKVIDERFEELPMVEIMINDTVKIGNTDFTGNFKVNVDSKIEKIIFRFLGCELTPIRLKRDCNNVEVIMLLSPTYCFYKPKKVERLRKKRFKRLSLLYKSAFEKGIFKSSIPCGNLEFVSHLKD